MPFFSIIIPTFNAEEKIPFCLRSILEQSFAQFEVIVLDAASTDRTVEKIKQIGDPRVNIHVSKDRGIYDAMNKGISVARGKWLYFSGADDRFYGSHTLENVFRAISERPGLDILYGDVFSEQLQRIYDGAFTPAKLFDVNICHQSIFLKSEVFQSVGMYNIDYRAYADWDHNIRWMLTDRFSVAYIPETIAFFGAGGLSDNFSDPAFNRQKLLHYVGSSADRYDRALRKKILLYQAIDAKRKNNIFSFIWYRMKLLLS